MIKSLRALSTIVSGLCLSLSVSAFGATVCLVAPGGAEIYVRDAAGNRIGGDWENKTLVTAADDEFARSDSRYLFVVTSDNESGYVSRSVVKDASACETSEPTPIPAPEAPVIDPAAPRPNPDTPTGYGTINLFGCGSDARASKCNRDALHAVANRSRHTSDYSRAREIVFFQVDVKKDANGHNYVQSVYSNDSLMLGISMPDSNKFNIEHTWPQSKLKLYPNFGQTKCDMHHLFAVETKINSIRGNIPFRDFAGEPSGQGLVPEYDASGFEPPEQQKGVVARAMFYMAVAYDMEIDAAQERTLRDWNTRFPVTASERERNQRVEANQGNINPFIENPEYASLVPDF